MPTKSTAPTAPLRTIREPELPRLTPEAAETGYLQIGEVAEQTGLTQRTLRYYEEVGLLDLPTRLTGSFRLYSAQDVARVQQIVRLKQLLGFSLAEIKAILDAQAELSQLRAAYQADPDAQHRLAALDRAEAVVRRQLDLIDEKWSQLQTMRADLLEKLARYDTRRAELRIVLAADAPPTE